VHVPITSVRRCRVAGAKGFEPPVLFVVPGAYERLEVFSGVTALKPIRELLSERSARQSLARKRPDFGPFSKGEKAKEDRRFESLRSTNEGTATRTRGTTAPY